MAGSSPAMTEAQSFRFHRPAFFDYHAACFRLHRPSGRWPGRSLASVKTPGQHRGNAGMTAIRRHMTAILTATILLAVPALSHAETVRIGLPTKTYWPTTVAEAAKAQKLFEKEGITAEITIYRGGADCFEALAAGAADN